MTLRILLTCSAAALATSLSAQDATGDAGAGEAVFDRQCTACHIVANDAGEVLAGRNAKTGPNLYGIVGAAPGSRHDFPYSDALVAYGETGVTWGEENLASFVQDPTGHLREALDDPRARSKMAYRLRSPDEARDVHAFLATFADAGEAAGEATEDAAGEAAQGDDAAAQTAEAAAAEPAEGAAMPAGDATAQAHDLDAGESIYKKTCRNCHGPKAQGMASFPRLAGQEAEYLVTRLEQYKAGETVGPNSALMIPIASKLSEEDIANVSAYIATSFE